MILAERHRDCRHRRARGHAAQDGSHANRLYRRGATEGRDGGSFKRPSKVFEDAVALGGMHLRMLGMSNVMPLDGGLLLLIDGKIVGAIGSSGVQSHQDAQVAQAGVSALTT